MGVEKTPESILRKMADEDAKRRLAAVPPSLIEAMTAAYVPPESVPGAFSVYLYGDTVKIVQVKAPPPRKREEDPLQATRKAKIRREIEKHAPNIKPPQTPGRFAESVRRSRARVFELAACNKWEWFCTFTQDGAKRARFDLPEFRKDLAQLVRNINRDRAEKVKYLLIPERHKNGAWHMHGLLSGLKPGADLRAFELSETLPYRIREQIEKGKPVFDWYRYRRAFGFFTCTAIGNKTAVAKYITKYITKDLDGAGREDGGHLFFASQGLQGREIVLHHADGAPPVNEWDFENRFVRVKEYDLSALSNSRIVDPNDPLKRLADRLSKQGEKMQFTILGK